MEDLIGVYGILDRDQWPDAPFLLLDGGAERRWREPYAFYNNDRGTYSGWLIQYTISGKGWFEKNGRKYEMSPGRGFLCRIPEDSRYYLEPEAEEPWTFFYFHFHGSAAEGTAEQLFSRTGDIFFADPDSEPIRIALQMHRKLKSGYRSEQYECGLFLYQFFCALLREVQRPERKQTHFFVREAMRQMDADCASVRGIEQLAEESRVSFAHFTRCFREETGVSPMQYLQEARIRKAITLLLNTGKSVEEIAAETGFSSGNYFGKVFRHHMGISPSAYRKERQNGAV